MSLDSKIAVIKRASLAELKKKEDELMGIKKNLDSSLAQARREILLESDRIDRRYKDLAKEEERINKHREAEEEQINKYREKVDRQIDFHINNVLDYFEELAEYGKEPKIIDAYISACYALDDKVVNYLRNKPHPATNAASTVAAYRKENLGYLQRIKDLEYQLSEYWAKDADTSEKEAFEYTDNDEERVRYFLSASEYQSLTESERNQRALDNYLKRNHTKSHIGKMYERYIGYLYESNGYSVEYRGIEMGLKDGGIDLICRKRGELFLVQCKNWSLDSLIYEKHICQLYGASKFYDKEHLQSGRDDELFHNADVVTAKPVFISTTNLDEHAIAVATSLGVEVRNIPFVRDYPIIKCNINNGEKIYHLPIDQMYDQTRICKSGECYVSTVREAESRGFRRAFRWNG